MVGPFTLRSSLRRTDGKHRGLVLAGGAQLLCPNDRRFHAVAVTAEDRERGSVLCPVCRVEVPLERVVPEEGS